MTDTDKEDLLTEYCDDLIDIGNIIVTKSKEKTTNVRKIVYVDKDGNDASENVYDFTYYEWKSTDTFDYVASSEMGDSEYATLLAYYNNVENESELESGTIFKIPVLVPTNTTSGNVIYTVPEEQDNYGTDIKIDSSGDFSVDGGDFGMVYGADNLQQAIINRLTTASTKRIRYSSYGIRNSIGDPMAVRSYLVSSISQTLETEPRIKSVDNIVLSGSGDRLNVDVFYTDINGNESSVRGEI